MEASAPLLYHEKQSLQKCAVHAVNNLLQAQTYTSHDFNKISNKLAPGALINPHRSFFGITGNYDINVIEIALQDKGYGLHWFDKRKDLSELPLSECLGLICNLRGRFLMVTSQHWIAVRKIGDSWYNLDSKLAQPEPIAEDKLREFFEFVLVERRGEILYVTRGNEQAQ